VRDFVGHFFLGAVRLAKQDGCRLEVVARPDEFLGRPGGSAVHHLEPGGNDPGRDDLGDRAAGFFHVVEGRHDDACELRLGNQLHRHLRHHPEHAFGADENGQQIESGRIE
jgi:hypothetical protein